MSLTVAVDFDGVLNTYTGWEGPDNLFFPREGVGWFLSRLSERYNVVIFTARNSDLVWDWLVEYGLNIYISKVTNIKPRAFIYIDDRGFKFNGDFEETLNVVDTFTTHWEPNSVEFVDSD